MGTLQTALIGSGIVSAKDLKRVGHQVRTEQERTTKEHHKIAIGHQRHGRERAQRERLVKAARRALGEHMDVRSAEITAKIFVEQIGIKDLRGLTDQGVVDVIRTTFAPQARSGVKSH